MGSHRPGESPTRGRGQGEAFPEPQASPWHLAPAPLFPGTPLPQHPCSWAPQDPCPPESLFPGILAPGTPAPRAQGPAVRRGSLPGCCLWGLLDIGQADRVRTAYLPTAERPRGGGLQMRVQEDSASSAGQGDRPSRLLRTAPRPLPHASWPGAWAEARSPGSWSHRVEASWPAAMDLPVDSAVLTGFAPRPGPSHRRVAPVSWKPRPPNTQPRRPRTLAPRKTAVLGNGGLSPNPAARAHVPAARGLPLLWAAHQCPPHPWGKPQAHQQSCV